MGFRGVHLTRLHVEDLMLKKKKTGYNPKAIATRLKAMSQGLKTALQPTDSLDVEGTATPTSQAASEVDGDLANYLLTDSKHDDYEAAKQVRDEAQPAVIARL